MIAYATGRVYDRGCLIGHIKTIKVRGKRCLQWVYIPQGRINPTIVCSSKWEVETRLGCRPRNETNDDSRAYLP